MNKQMIVAASLWTCMLVPVLAHAQMNNTTQMNATSTSTSGGVSADDKNFMMMAAQGGMTEVKTSKVAKSKSSSKDVEAFAQHMIDDHKKANDQLMSIAKKLNVSVPKSLDTAHEAELKQLKNASKSDFDQKYIAVQDKEHNDALTAFQTEANTGNNPMLKAFAAQTLPILQGHMAEVKKLEAAMPPAATTGTMDTTK